MVWQSNFKNEGHKEVELKHKQTNEQTKALTLQPRSQGLSSYRPLRRARRDPGTRWSRAALTIENIREGSSVIRQFVALSFVKFKVSRCAATDITRDV